MREKQIGGIKPVWADAAEMNIYKQRSIKIPAILTFLLSFLNTEANGVLTLRSIIV